MVIKHSFNLTQKIAVYSKCTVADHPLGPGYGQGLGDDLLDVVVAVGIYVYTNRDNDRHVMSLSRLVYVYTYIPTATTTSHDVTMYYVIT